MKKTIVVLLSCFIYFEVSIAQVGTWRNYLAYAEPQQIQSAGTQLFVLASGGLYLYNKQDQSIYTFDKTNGMSDTNITNIKWCSQAKRLVVVYNNSNIDLVETNGNVTNINDIYARAITGGKTIYSIAISGQYAYLACEFGIVKINVRNAEISETYQLGFPVNAIAFDNTNIYANSSTKGIWTASLSTNLIDPANWTQTINSPSFDEDQTDYNDNIELVKTLKPDGPKHNIFGFIRFINGKLYTCSGAYYTPGTIQVFDNKKQSWQIYQDENISETTGVQFIGTLCVDVRQTADGEQVYAGSRTGLYEYLNGKFVNYYGYKNSPIERFNGKSENYQLVTGVKFYQDHSLYILNSQAPTASLICLKDGKFTKFNHDELMKLNDGGFTNKSNGNLSNMIVDRQGFIWFVNNHGGFPAFYRYQSTTDKLLTFNNFVNQDGTDISIAGDGGVRCVAEDIDGNMWAGTSVGPLLLEKSQIESPTPIYTQVKVPRNDGTNYADYLLDGIDITAIVIDGGGRKWFSTNNNGVYLISTDNMTQLQHFTTENSPLLSNTIRAMAINQDTGEVFFGTENGLCSYVSDATKTNDEMTKDNVWAYPNPVEPSYTGPITITGLTLNADVKILSANGAVINEGKSNGGTYIWDGCDKKGRRVASGVYMVATATKNGDKGTVCKIAVIN